MTDFGLTCTDLGESLVLGSCPRSSQDVDLLRGDLRIDTVVNLQTNADISHLGIHWPALWRALVGAGIEVVRVPIRDLDSKDLERGFEEAVEAVTVSLAAGRRVYLHCTAGINRSPTVAIAVLAGPLGHGFSKAVARVHARPHVVPALAVAHAWLLRRHPSSAGELDAGLGAASHGKS